MVIKVRMNKREPTLMQRLWYSDFKVLVSTEDLEERIGDALNQRNVKRAAHSDTYLPYFTGLGILKRKGRKTGIPVVLDQHGNSYVLQPTNEDITGKLFSGNITSEPARGGIIGHFQGNRQMPYEDPTTNSSNRVVSYNVKQTMTFSETLGLTTSNVPVYEGNTYNFTSPLWGFISSIQIEKPLVTATTRKEEAQISGVIYIPESDIPKLQQHYKKMGYVIFPEPKPKKIKTAEHPKAAATGEEEHQEVLYHGKNVPTIKPPRVPNYKAQDTMTKDVRDQLRIQSSHDNAEIRNFRGIDDLIDSVVHRGIGSDAYVNTEVTGLERIRVGNNIWKGEVYIATTRTPGELYLILDPPNKKTTGIYEITQEDGEKVLIHRSRPLKDKLNWWPHGALNPQEVIKKLWWKLGVGARIEIDGYVVVPSEEDQIQLKEYKGGRIAGIVGMNNEKWREIYVQQAAYEVVKAWENTPTGADASHIGARDDFVLDKARAFYQAHPLLEAVSGGETQFTTSTLRVVRGDYEVLKTELLGRK